MKKYVLVGLLVFGISHLSFAEQAKIDIPAINRYYSDYNYVVAYSSPAERRMLAHYAAAARLEDSILKDGRLRTLYEMIRGLRAAQLDQDPRMVWGNRLGEDLLYAKVPVSVSRIGANQLSVDTLRYPVRARRQDSAAGAPDFSAQRFDPGTTDGFWYSETDRWILVDGKWFISSLHFYLVAR